MARGPTKEKAIALAPATAAHANSEVDELVRKRDAFVNSMTMLRDAAEEASRASLTYFDHAIGVAANGDHTHTYQHGISMPARAMTEDPETGKRTRRKREKRDPDLPKRPMTAYLLFCNHGRETVKRELPETASHKDIIAELTQRWSKVPDEEKKAWQDLYQKNRAVYDKELADYKASKDPHTAASIVPTTITAPATTPATAPASGFTAVNHTETAEESDVESEAENEDEPAPIPAPVPISAPAAATAADPDPESELSEAEEIDEEDEEEEKSPSPPPKSPTPPPKSKATPRGKKAVANGTKKAPISTQVNNPPKEEKRKRTSSRKKAAAEEEAVVVEETPKKRAKKRRKSSGD